MASYHTFDRLPSYTLTTTRRHDALLFAVGLLVGLVGAVPTFTLLVRWLGVPLPLSSLIGVGIVIAVYAAVIVVLRRIVTGTFVALLVLSTFAANVPLPGFELSYAGWMGPALWLFHPALAAGLVIAAVQRWDRDVTLTRTHYALFAFVIWSFLAVVFGAGPRPDAALWFAIRMVITAVVFALVAAAVQSGRIDLRTVVAVLILSVFAHAAFAGIELIHQGSFGLTRLGENDRYSTVAIVIGPLRLAGGSYLAGFMGSSVALYSLSVLCVPVLLLYALFASGRAWIRWAAAVGVFGLFALVRLTFRDAGRGAALLVLAAVVGAVSFTFLRSQHRRAMSASLEDIRRRLVGVAAVVVASALALLYPGSASGDAVEVTAGKTQPGTNTGDPTGGTSAGGSTATLAERLDGLAIPLFDISTLGVRALQYLATIDVTLRHPVFGLGGSNFPYIASRYGLHEASAPNVDVGRAVHNAYLAVLVGTGVPGFVFFVATLVGVAWSCLALVRHHTVERWLALGLCCGLLGYFASIFWDIQFATIAGWIPFWALAGAIVGTAAKKR